MKGAVAAGHPATATAGARILEQGGNAVDACIAAGFVSWVAESPLTGPGAGGFMLVHRGRERTDRVLDFFVAIPGRGLPAGDDGGEMLTVEVAFDARTVQCFRIGPASCAVPGAVAGLAEAHRLYARLPWSELIAPAVELARRGVELSGPQAFFHEILDVALRLEPAGRRIYGEQGPLGAGDTLVMSDLAATLEWIAAEGPETFYAGELARRIVETVRGGGGRITDEDLASYRVIRRRPVRARGRVREPAGAPSTTHVSVVDAAGNAASLSASTGCGSGVVVPETGIQLNNMLGEEDLSPGGRGPAGRRLTSMMAPSLVLEGGTPRLVVGSAGSIRLRAAILQIVLNVVDHGMSAVEAIDAPRIHLDGDVLQLEGGIDAEAADRLEDEGYEVSRWEGLNVYFGGAAAVVLRPSGGLEAAGDPRRGGAGGVVG